MMISKRFEPILLNLPKPAIILKSSPIMTHPWVHVLRVLTSIPGRAIVNFSKMVAKAVKQIKEKNVSEEVVEK